MTPTQIVSIVVATIISAIVIVFTIKENQFVAIKVEDDTVKRETADIEDNNELFSFQDVLKETLIQN